MLKLKLISFLRKSRLSRISGFLGKSRIPGISWVSPDNSISLIPLMPFELPVRAKLISFDINQAALDLVPGAEELLAKSDQVTVKELEELGVPMGRAFLEMAIRRGDLEEALKSLLWSKEKALWDLIQDTDFSARGRIEFRIEFGKTAFQVRVKVRISRSKRLRMEMTDLGKNIMIVAHVLEQGFQFSVPDFTAGSDIYLQGQIFPWGKDGIHTAALAKKLLEELRGSDA